MNCDLEDEHHIIRVGDKVRYLPTSAIFDVKEIYADSAVGTFHLSAGDLLERRAVIIPSNYAGHYPVGDDIAKICPKCKREIKQGELDQE